MMSEDWSQDSSRAFKAFALSQNGDSLGCAICLHLIILLLCALPAKTCQPSKTVVANCRHSFPEYGFLFSGGHRKLWLLKFLPFFFVRASVFFFFVQPCWHVWFQRNLVIQILGIWEAKIKGSRMGKTLVQ